MNIDDLTEILRQNGVAAPTIKQIITDLKQAAEDNKGTAGPKAKNKFVVLLNSPTNELTNAQAWVVQVPEETAAADIMNKVSSAAREFNANTRKGKKNPVRTLADAALTVTRKFFKAAGVNIKTKIPVETIVTDGMV